MSLIYRIFAFTLVLLSLPNGKVFAQEMLVPVGVHPGGTDHRKSSDEINIPYKPDSLEIPFFDDFSRKGELPFADLWKDNFVFINNTYTAEPITIGVATFDAINYDGTLNGNDSKPFESDFLTSLPINLNYPGRDDIYLSFFYQPMGLGDSPEAGDSLVLEFYAPARDSWERVWAAEGSDKDTFLQVHIQVSDSGFLQRGFQFRFKNYASLANSVSYPSYNGNVDHWNIDYVYLDKGRSPTVTNLKDVSMITNPGSIIKSYNAIPWRHFANAMTTDITPYIDISYRNNDAIIRNVTRRLEITDLTVYNKYEQNGGAVNVEPGVVKKFQFPYNYPFIAYDKDSVTFEIKSYLITDDLDYKWNDTVVRYQNFYNYYAYDDGTAENGYGLSGEGTNKASVACRFDSFKKDTLIAVQMSFNRTLNDESQDYFILAIWDHNELKNQPGNLIFTKSGVRPEYSNEINRFHSYSLDTGIVVKDIFYVGWVQTTANLLNIGFDRNNNSQKNILYNLGQDWTNTRFSGSLMMRPVFGHPPSVPAPTQKLVVEDQIGISPNPASDWLNIELKNVAAKDILSVQILNLQGQLVYQGQISGERLNISHIPAGLYILRINDGYSFHESRKILIFR